MLLAIVEAGFFPKVQWGHRSTSCHERPWATGRKALVAGQLPSAQPILPQEVCKDSVPATQQGDPSLPAAACVPSPRFPHPEPLLSLDLLSSSAHPNSARPTYSSSAQLHHPHLNRFTPLFSHPCDMNGITLSGGSLVCLQDD